MKLKILFFVAFIASFLSAAHGEPLAYEMDKNHTIIQFSWNHNRLADMSGRFLAFDGEFDLDFEEPSNSKVSFRIDPASIWTGVEKLDEDMRSKRLFDVAQFDEITFVSTTSRKTGLERGQLEGNLTIKGITKQVVLFIDVNYHGPHLFAGVEEYKDAVQAGITLHARVNRSDFDLGMAVPWIADEIDIRVDTEMVAWPMGKPEATVKE